jgi:Na+/H+-dicarboxylate symporter
MKKYGGSALKVVETEASRPGMVLSIRGRYVHATKPVRRFVRNSHGLLGDALPPIAFALLAGAAGTQLSNAKRDKLQAGRDLISEVMTGIVGFALRLAPYAVPAMI